MNVVCGKLLVQSCNERVVLYNRRKVGGLFHMSQTISVFLYYLELFACHVVSRNSVSSFELIAESLIDLLSPSVLTTHSTSHRK